jgi:hypothetical protein
VSTNKVQNQQGEGPESIRTLGAMPAAQLVERYQESSNAQCDKAFRVVQENLSVSVNQPATII